MHGPMASIESNLLINGNWAATGIDGLPDLSEDHIDWWNGFTFFYNGDLDYPNPNELYQTSGNFEVASAYFSRGGPLGEVSPWSDEEAPPQFDVAYENFYVGDIEQYFLGDGLSNIDQIKQIIMTHGAVSSCINWTGEFMTGDDHYQPPETFPPPNHVIAIVGWDDNRVTPAPLPGAWLCKNNYGTAWKDNGYFWVSYYDKHCCRHPQIGVYSFQNADYLPDGQFYNYFYYYDYHGWRRTKTDCDEAFNAFIAPRDQIMRKVSFFTASDSVTYNAIVYDSFESGQLSGQLAAAGGMIEHRGFHTVDLGTEVNLSAGQDFYIYLQLSSGGQPYDCTAPLGPTFVIISNGVTVPSHSEPGQSYFYNGSAWQDLYEYDTTANFCIKGIATELAPLPVDIIVVLDGGDGASLEVEFAPKDTTDVDSVMVCCEDTVSGVIDTLITPKAVSQVLFEGLIEGHQYRIYAIAIDHSGRKSLGFSPAYGTPYSIPAQPQQIATYTLNGAIKISWRERNTELDFDHYTVFRDGAPIPDDISDTSYVDNDPAIGTDFHTYMVAAVDSDGNMSDTIGADTASMRAADLRPGEILAINRSGSNSTAMVDETVTGEFMREALDGLSYIYFSDTAGSNPLRAGLMNMIDYGLIVIGAESGRQDDIGGDPNFGGILNDIGYYLSIGGKAVIFGRWGDIAIDATSVDTVRYYPGTFNGGYKTAFNVDYRVIPRTYINTNDMVLESDMIGGYNQIPEYPELVWDSIAAAGHSGALGNITGIPCPSYSVLTGSDYEVIYTYNSSVDSLLTEGMPVAWRSTGGQSRYVFFDLPLSFMERPAAVAALRQAVGDMGIISDSDPYADPSPLPREFSLAQNYPNPFNPATAIEFYNPEPRPSEVTLDIYNILGQKVRILFDGLAAPGRNRVEWDGCDESHNPVASGIYFYRLKTEITSLTRKMLLLK